MEILVDKVKYEHEIRILKEQAATRDRLMQQERAENKELKERVQEQDQALVYVLKRLDKIEATGVMTTTKNSVKNKNTLVNAPVNIPINVTNNNNQQINNVHFHINNFDEPNIEGLIFPIEEIGKCGKLIDHSLKKTYFNPDRPENHSLYVSNRKTGDVVAFNGGWRLYQGEQAREVAIIAMKKASDVSYQNCMHYEYAGMHDFLNASPATQEVIREFTRSINDLPLDMLDIERHPTDSFYQIAVSNRDVVLKTIKDSGCKLIK
ncbi:hypothetical protein EBR37_04095 [bacterium]|nr:hypothetical protein [bacterium]